MKSVEPRSSAPFSLVELEKYRTEGYLLVPGLFSAAEIEPLRRALEADPEMGGSIYPDNYADSPDLQAPDHAGPSHEYIGWTGPGGDDWVGVMIRSERIVNRAQQLVGEPVYHWHTNLVRKPAMSNGRITWHSDLGGWYEDGVLEPSFTSCVVAITPTNQNNGCLHFMRGSHRTGRLDRVPDEYVEFSIPPKRLAAMLERYEPEAIEMQPGDGVFFHPAAVHSSQANQSNAPRTQMIFTYNALSNPPFLEHVTHHAVHAMEKASDPSLIDGWTEVWGKTRITRINDPEDPAARVYGQGRSLRRGPKSVSNG